MPQTIRVTPALGRAIIRGDKTTHRIPAGRQEVCPYRVWEPPRVVEVDGDIYTGRERGVYRLEYEQRLTDPDTGRAWTEYGTRTVLRVYSITRERLEDITDDTARAEGFDSFALFLDYWNDTYNPYADTPGEEDARRYLTERRMRGFVWVLHFTAEQQDKVHLLPNLPHEPEAVDPDLVADLPASLIARQRWVRDRAAAERELADLPITQRLAHALAQAKAERRDTSSAEFIIAKQIERIRNSGRRAA